MSNTLTITQELSAESLELIGQIVEERVRKILDAQPGAQDDRWFDLKELCEYMPGKPKKSTVYGWISLKTIPHNKQGKNLSFLKSEIDEWLKSGRRKTSREISDAARNHKRK